MLARLHELKQFGVHIYGFSAGGGFAILHHKLWIIDGETMLTGSINATTHGLDANTENLLVCREYATVMSVYTEWVNTSRKATYLSQGDLQNYLQDYQRRRDTERSSRSSRSQSVQR